MNSAARVKIWGQVVGAIRWDEKKRASYFQYDSQFLNSGIELSPIYMPLSKGNEIYNFKHLNFETYRGLPGLLADSLTDAFGNKLIDMWLAQEGRSREDFSPIERLCYIGNRGMGALEFEPMIERPQVEFIKMSHLVQLTNQILKEKESFKTTFKKSNNLQDIINVGTSAGGMRPKAVIAIHKKTKEIRSGQIELPKEFEYWLLKFDGVSGSGFETPKGYGRIEYAYYLMAQKLGIDMSDCKIYKENGRSHFMTKRFDRQFGYRHHLQTLCGMDHCDYRMPGYYSYEQLFQVMRKLHFSYQDVEQMFKRMAFNIIARNQDDHTKNISFLLKKGEDWRLAPAYDLTFSYNPGGLWTSKHHMMMSGKDDHFVEDDFNKVATSLGINKWRNIMKEVVQVVKHWPDFAKKAGVYARQIKSVASHHRTKLKF